MKKFIAIAMSGLLALSSVSVAAVAEPVVPSVNAVTDMAWSQNARPVSAEELAQIRSQLPEKNVMPKDPEDDIHTGYGVITGPLIEAVMSMAQEAAVDSESQVEPPVLAQITASMAVLEYREGYDLEEIREIALAMGMVPMEQLETVQISVPVVEAEEQAQEPSGWEAFCTFLAGLFA